MLAAKLRAGAGLHDGRHISGQNWCMPVAATSLSRIVCLWARLSGPKDTRSFAAPSLRAVAQRAFGAAAIMAVRVPVMATPAASRSHPRHHDPHRDVDPAQGGVGRLAEASVVVVVDGSPRA